jgi:hypothetical protein
VRLKEEDAVRMRRLHEEISGRVEEMALIAARNLNMKVNGEGVRMFHPVRNEKARQIEFEGVEIICYPNGVCACYDYDSGECYEC